GRSSRSAYKPWGGAEAPPRCIWPSAVIRALAMRCEVEPAAFVLGADAQADCPVDDQVERGRGQRAPADRDRHRLDLDPDLRGHREIRRTGPAEPRRGEDAGADGADDAADAVNAEHVEAVVVAEAVLDDADEVVADRRGKSPEGARPDRADRTRRRRDGDQPRDKAGRCTEHRRLA